VRAKHLGPCELVDLVEGGAAREHTAHVEKCGRCRARIAELRSALTAAREVGVPEPLPQFWEAFSTRVRAAIGAKKERRAARSGPAVSPMDRHARGADRAGPNRRAL